jgi:hypothetical protein
MIDPSAFADCGRLESFFVPRAVRVLSVRCFCGCSKLSTLEFEADSQLSRIDPDAFLHCSSLRSLHIPRLVALTSGSGLAGVSFDSITVDEGNHYLTIRGSFLLNSSDPSLLKCWGTDDEVVIPSFIETLSDYSFSGSPVRRVIFEPVSRLSILGISAFSNCTSLISICIPASVEQIQSKCFEGCLNLREFGFESGSKAFSFGGSAFSQTGLNSICIPALLHEIGKSCFSGSRLSGITFNPNGKLSKIQESAFYGSGIRSICIPRSLTSILSHCFQECRSLSIVTFESPSNIRLLPEYVFSFCSSLESICVPKSVDTISDGAFASCSGLSAVLFEIPSQLNSIGSSAFARCTSLNSISIPASVHKICARCFEKCTVLSQVDFARGSLRCSVSPDTFEGCLGLKWIFVPPSLAVHFEIGILHHWLYGGAWKHLAVITPDAAIAGFENIPPSKQVANIPGGPFARDDEFLVGYEMLLQDVVIG